MAPPVIVFDVNETLLDLSALRSPFEGIFGPSAPLGEWFARMLHGSLVANLTDSYRSFGEIGVEALEALAKKRHVELESGQAERVVAMMKSLPPHPDVPSALQRLTALGYRMITLTNSSIDVAGRQLENAGITQHFEAALSVETVRKFKPSAEPYTMALDHLGIGPDEAVMVAAHDWDVHGAQTVGMAGAFLDRPGAVWSIKTSTPGWRGPNLNEFVHGLEHQ